MYRPLDYKEAVLPIDHSYSASSSREDLVVHVGEPRKARQNPHLAIAIDRSVMEARKVDEESVRQIAFSSLNSVEESAPPSPTSGPAPNFGEVAPGIYRSSFPRMGNFDHLRSLKLKTILTLVSGDYPAENVEFMHDCGIQHFQIPIPAHKDPLMRIPLENIRAALKIILDPNNRPLLIHCNKGKHRTGCIIAVLRKLHDWRIASILAEYRRYAGLKARELDERFIESFDESTVVQDLTQHNESVNLASSWLPSSSQLPTPPPSERSVKDDLRDDTEYLTTRSRRGGSKASDRSLI
ncbi:MAG: hypothetical protein MMC33_000908 [Icmadophila ericetorum]|nr:hypothetical protein [Icmadophila ericetorum]